MGNEFVTRIIPAATPTPQRKKELERQFRTRFETEDDLRCAMADLMDVRTEELEAPTGQASKEALARFLVCWESLAGYRPDRAVLRLDGMDHEVWLSGGIYDSGSLPGAYSEMGPLVHFCETFEEWAREDYRKSLAGGQRSVEIYVGFYTGATQMWGTDLIDVPIDTPEDLIEAFAREEYLRRAEEQESHPDGPIAFVGLYHTGEMEEVE